MKNRNLASILQSITVPVLLCMCDVSAGKGGGKPPKGDPPPPLAAITYQVTWLGDFGGTQTKAWDVNQTGTVVGSSEDANGELIALIYTDNAGMQDLNDVVLPPTGYQLISAVNINSNGRIVGQFVDDVGEKRVYVYDPLLVPSFQPLPEVSTPQSVTDLSEDGTVLGYVRDVNDNLIPYAWQPGQAVEWLLVAWRPTGINSVGEVVGRTDSDSVWRYTIATDELQIIGGETHRSLGTIDVNDFGEVAGSQRGKGNRFYPNVFSDDGGWQQLGSTNGVSQAINNAGQVCGQLWQKTFNDPDTVFVFDLVDGYWSVDDLIDGTVEDVALWFTGDFDDDMRPLGMSEAAAVYPFIAGYKVVGADHWEDGIPRALGFVLTPVAP